MTTRSTRSARSSVEAKQVGFCDALIAIECGKRVRRAKWRYGRLLFRVPAFCEEGGRKARVPWIAVRYCVDWIGQTFREFTDPWQPRQQDILARDWIVIER